MGGLPFIANDLPYLRSVCETYGVGEVTDLQSEDAIAHEVGKIFADPSKYRQMRDAAVKARKVLNWEVEGAKLLEIYRTSVEPLIGKRLDKAV